VERQPEKAAELERTWRQWNAELAPPAWAPDTSRPKAATAGGIDGWVARGCKIGKQAGVLLVEGQTPRPYIANFAMQVVGPTELRVRLRSPSGGAGRVEWRLSDQPEFVARQAVDFRVAAGDWQEARVALPVPAAATLVHVRLYVPAAEKSVEVSRIQCFRQSEPKRPAHDWNFAKP
jgi:hypothetical protein